MLKHVSAALISTLLMMGSAMADPNMTKPVHTLSLTGHGEVKLAPDMAIVDIGTQSQGQSAKAALEANNKNMAALLKLLKEGGIADKDMQTSNFSVQPTYDTRPSSTPKINGYQVDNSVTVIVRKLDDLGGLLDKAVSTGSNQISNITFSASSPGPAQDEARKVAVADAKHKAQLLTEAAGVKIMALQSMIENSAYQQPVPMARFNRANASMAADAAPSVPMAQGQLVVTADVSMVWELE